MKFLFKPVINLMNRLKFTRKFTLIFIIFLIPLLTTNGYIISRLNQEVKLRDGQKKAVEYNVYLRALIKNTQEHRGMSSAYLNGDTSFKEKIKSQQALADEIIKNIDSLDGRYGTFLDSTTDWNNIRLMYGNLRGDLESYSGDESFTNHTSLIHGMFRLTEKTATNSAIMLQDNMQAYSLMDTVTLKLPS